jgi:hypothetical protein
LKRIATRLGSAKNVLDVDDSDALRLLSDVRQIFTTPVVNRIGTSELVSRLQRMEESPWGDITQFKLARTLRSFGVSSKQLWINERNIKGYEHDDLKSVFESYLSR